MSNRESFSAGVKDVSPLIPGIIPFAMISGITAVSVGIPHGMALAISVLVFAGASQLAMSQLIGAGAASFVIIYTAIIINLRFVVYSASIAPYLKSPRSPLRLLHAYLLTDHGYAISAVRLREDNSVHPHWYYLGASVPLWLTWQVFSAAGIYLGSGVPESWGLDFAIPLSFMAILVNACRDGNSLAAGIAGGTVAVIAHPLPLNLGLIMGVVAGILVGLSIELLIRDRQHYRGGG